MLISEISQFDQSFSIVAKNIPDDLNLKGICDRYSLASNYIFFCGAKSFWNTLKENSSEGKLENIFVIFQEDFLSTVESEVQDVLAKSSGWGKVKSVPLAISALSRPFYDQIQLTFNNEIDGRKLGTVKIDPTAKISENVFLGADVEIAAGVVIHAGSCILSQSKVGEDTVIYPNVTLMSKTVVGRTCRIHSGTVVGSDGFGYNFEAGVHKKVWHMGGVVIGNDVEIGSNTSIDQGTFSPTIIGDGCKLDNQVQVGHNVHLGRGVILCGQVGVAGSTVIEDYCVFGGQAGVAPDVRIGAGAQVAGGAGVTGSLDKGAIVAGHPARPIKEWLRGNATLRKLSLKK